MIFKKTENRAFRFLGLNLPKKGVNYYMDKTLILPTILIIIDIGASLVYLLDGNYNKAIYWLAAAVLTSTVTYANLGGGN